MRQIVTSYQNPPIPTRSMDWCAHYSGEEEAGNYGWGATEAEAIQDFRDNCQADHDERLGETPRRMSAQETLAACEIWIAHWLRDVESGLAPTEASLRDMLETVRATRTAGRL